MLRILLLLVPVLAIYYAIRWFQTSSSADISKQAKKLVGWAVIILLLLLAASGKLSVLFAMLGVAIAFIVRLMPVILHYAPQLHRLWQLLSGGRSSYQQTSARQPPRGGMTKAEALDVLGLKPDASKQDIIDAHRKLISKLHPDRGGSDYLAAQINLAKKTLLAD